MKIAFLLAALCGMLLAATAMTFDDDDIMDQLLQDPTSMGNCRGCSTWGMNDPEEPVTADEIVDMLRMMDAPGGGRDRGRGDRGDRERGDRRGRNRDPVRGGIYYGRGGYNEDIFQSPATTTGNEMMQDPLLGFGWGWGSPWGGWGGWGRRGWGWGGRGWGWGGRGWGGRRFFDSDDSSNQEMQGEEPETISADDLEDMMTLDPQGGMGGGFGRDRYRGDRDRYRGDRDRYRGDRDRYSRGGRNEINF
ncbi:hypothetical protein DAPPUDRAFT_101360 [Daphnia pulex]|uniref:Uncharacterized protein n=1 Tax=Daphnia pulex TaxID=6669 RepID=E9GD51_DAPPU|nr:hypothetical protein DAPPUDRAFT_101360 [Daphnia pulex]|eukprot:EFX82754.1 hypothetical protein DAPPUDRAFT_101360 [Daphnia pulex]